MSSLSPSATAPATETETETASNGDTGDAALNRKSSSIYFGVYGEGKSKRILGYGSSFSSSFTDSHNSSWVCTFCCYDNIDSSNNTCSMCGNARVEPKRGSLPSLAEGRPSSQMELPDEPLGQNSNSSLPRILNKEESLRLCSLRNEDPVQETPSDDDVVKRIAHQSVSEVGGWTCETCTFVNRNDDHLSCAVCGSERKQQSPTDGTFFGHSSIEDFFSSSMKNALDVNEASNVDRQIELCRGFEEQMVERETMAQLIAHQKQVMAEIVLNEARARKQEQDRVKMLKTPEGRDQYLTNLSEKLRRMELAHIQEREEIHAMEALQNERRQKIEEIEGVTSIYSLVGGGAMKPGAQHVSLEAVEWIAQQRMLDDWKEQLHERELETEGLRQMSAQARTEE